MTRTTPAQDKLPSADLNLAAFLFSYDIKPGLQADFERGYERHLDWHRKAADPFVWYGWFVVTGDNAGRFVDGTFGLTFTDFNKRVSPQADMEDAIRNVSPYVIPVNRSVLRLRADLGSNLSLEQLKPAKMLEVTTYELQSGWRSEFEAAIAAHPDASQAATWYELVSGGAPNTYIRMVPGEGFGLYGKLHVIDTGQAVVNTSSETWLYKENLSYFPAD